MPAATRSSARSSADQTLSKMASNPRQTRNKASATVTAEPAIQDAAPTERVANSPPKFSAPALADNATDANEHTQLSNSNGNTQTTNTTNTVTDATVNMSDANGHAQATNTINTATDATVDMSDANGHTQTTNTVNNLTDAAESTSVAADSVTDANGSGKITNTGNTPTDATANISDTNKHEQAQDTVYIPTASNTADTSIDDKEQDDTLATDRELLAQKEAELEQVVKKRKILTKEVSDLKKKTGVDGVECNPVIIEDEGPQKVVVDECFTDFVMSEAERNGEILERFKKVVLRLVDDEKQEPKVTRNYRKVEQVVKKRSFDEFCRENSEEDNMERDDDQIMRMKIRYLQNQSEWVGNLLWDLQEVNSYLQEHKERLSLALKPFKQ